MRPESSALAPCDAPAAGEADQAQRGDGGKRRETPESCLIRPRARVAHDRGHVDPRRSSPAEVEAAEETDDHGHVVETPCLADVGGPPVERPTAGIELQPVGAPSRLRGRGGDVFNGLLADLDD